MPPNRNAEYMIVVDPKGFGVKHQWGLTVWERDDAACARQGRAFIREVAWASGHDDPLAQRDAIVKIATRWQGARRPLLVVESNKESIIVALQNYAIEHPELVAWTLYGILGKPTPGWWSSPVTKDRAITTYVEAVKNGNLLVNSQEVVKQALAYDRVKGWATGRDSAGGTHHFDRLITHFIAADVAKMLGWIVVRPEKKEPVVPKEPDVLPVPDSDFGYTVSHAYMEKLIEAAIPDHLKPRNKFRVRTM